MRLIEAIPANRVMGIQMSDGPLVPAHDDYYEDCLWNRQPPGQGEFGAVAFVRSLLDKGVTVPWSVEVCQRNAWGPPARPHLQSVADGMRGVLAEGGLTLGSRRE